MNKKQTKMIFMGGLHNKNKAKREKESKILYGISYNSHTQKRTKWSRRATAVVKEQLRSFF